MKRKKINKMELYVDRIEKDVVVCVDENGKIFKIKMDKMFKNNNITEGSVVVKLGKKFVLDEEATKKRRLKLFNLQKDLFDR